MSNYQNTSQHYGAPQGNSSQHYGNGQGSSSQYYGAPKGSSSQHYGSPQGSAPAPIRRNEATASAPNGTPSENTRKARWVFILLVVLFGGLGIHNFYAGYYKKGAIQLGVTLVGGALTGGVAGIAMCLWAVYEAFVVKIDAKGLPFV